MWSTSCPDLQNWNETFLGLAFALTQAQKFNRENFSKIHAVWATMPATAALGIHQLVNIPFSTGAHAYDVFRHGGDWLLPLKLKNAFKVRTSSQSTAKRLSILGASNDKLVLIHRSLHRTYFREDFELVQCKKISLLCIGRLVEKKGYFLLIQILQCLKKRNIAFHLNIIGGGVLENEIRREIHIRGLDKKVSLLGHVDEDEMEKFYHHSDALLFTGIVSSNGDRDGIPNVIPEAMIHGLLVLASNRAGSSEAFVDRVSGFSLDPYHPGPWVNLLSQFCEDPKNFIEIRKSAILHAESLFSAKVNCQNLKNLLE